VWAPEVIARTPGENPRLPVDRPIVIDELMHNGFDLIADFEHWFGNTYCVVFRRPDRST
jgi:hypothetical protein